MRQSPRLALATFLSPLAVGPAVLLWTPLLAFESIVRDWSTFELTWLLSEWLEIAVFFAIFGGVAAFLANLVVGMPLYLLFRSVGLATPVPAALFAGAIGLALGEAVAADGEFFSIIAVSAAAVAASFCWLANRPRR